GLPAQAGNARREATSPRLRATITIVDSPAQTSTSDTATFAFTVDPAENLRCLLDGEEKPLGPCTSPQTYPGLVNGPHSFVVQEYAYDPDSGPVSQRYRWTVAVPPPETTITAGPSGTVSDRVATFTFSSDQKDA